MKFTDEEGKVWHTITYRIPQKGDLFVEGGSQQIKRADWNFTSPEMVRLIVRPVPTIHEFGGVKFEETGEKRKPEVGEWFANELGYPVYTGYPHSGRVDYTILRPLQGE